MSLCIDAEPPKNVRINQDFQRSKFSARNRAVSIRQDKTDLTPSAFSSEWIVKSGCHFSCINQSMGVQIVASKRNQSNNIQLCHAEIFVRVSSKLLKYQSMG